MEFWSFYSTIFGDDTPSSYVILTCHHYSLSALFSIKQNIPGSPCPSQPQPWDQPFLQGVLLLLEGECYLETKIWVLSVLTVVGMSLL